MHNAKLISANTFRAHLNRVNTPNMNILVVSSSDGITLSLLRCLSRIENAHVHVLDIWGASHFAKSSRYCGQYSSYPAFSTSFMEEALIAIRDRIEAHCSANAIDIVIPIGLLGTFVIADLAKQIKSAAVFPLTNIDTLHEMHHKWEFYLLLRKHGIPTPQTILVERGDQDLSCVNIPAMVKPLDGGNGEGVQRIETTAALREYLLAADRQKKLPVLVQEFAAGEDVCLNVLADRGEVVAWTINLRDSAYFRFFRNDQILDLGRKIVAAENFTGVANFDVRFDVARNSAVIIECNPRFWGSFPATISSGIDFIGMGIAMAQGRDLSSFVKHIDRDELIVHFYHTGGFVKGLIRGTNTMPFSQLQKTLGWTFLTDILPTIADKASTPSTTAYDGDIVRALLCHRRLRMVLPPAPTVAKA